MPGEQERAAWRGGVLHGKGMRGGVLWMDGI